MWLLSVRSQSCIAFWGVLLYVTLFVIQMYLCLLGFPICKRDKEGLLVK